MPRPREQMPGPVDERPLAVERHDLLLVHDPASVGRPPDRVNARRLPERAASLRGAGNFRPRSRLFRERP
ncbi:hypothetical protein GCM10010388_45340 [Streptomyces mauvecolor]